MKINISLEKFSFSIESDVPVDLGSIPIIGALLDHAQRPALPAPTPAAPLLDAIKPPVVNPAHAAAPPAAARPPRKPRITGASPVKTRRNGVALTCDQHPGRTFTVKEAAALAGVKPSSVHGALAHGFACKGLMFRRAAPRDATAQPAATEGGDGDDDPDPDPEPEPKPPRKAKPPMENPNHAAGVNLTYDLGAHRTRGEAAGDLMPVNGRMIAAFEPPTPRDLQVKL